MNMETWVAGGSAVLAIASLVASWVIAGRQSTLQFETLRAEMDAGVIAWAQQAMGLVSQAAALARGRGGVYAADEFQRLTLELEFGLSAAVDQGRLFFPNEDPAHWGQDKEGAFQGIRPPILDALVFCCCQIEQMRKSNGEGDQEAARFFIDCRRLLVSEAQNAIDPRRRREMMRRLDIGRADDSVSNWDKSYELGMELDKRHPNLAPVQAFLTAHRTFRKVKSISP
jgi:hypothetical protein